MTANKKIQPLLTTLMIILISTSLVHAKTDTLTWITLGAAYKPNAKNTMSFSLLNGYKKGLDYSFKQFGFAHSYKINRDFYARSYLNYTYVGDGNRVTQKHRLGVAGTYRFHKDDVIRLYYRQSVEWNSKGEKRFKLRLIQQLIARTKPIKISKKQRLSFYSNLITYLRFNGKPISQYDGEGHYLGEASPAGFHRVRLNLGASYRIDKTVISCSIMRQQEFNFLSGSQSINQPDIETGKIKHRFKNQNVFALSIRYILDNKVDKDKVDIQETINQL